jgi:hypothetical protein
LLLFVLVDGWAMTVGSLVSTFSVGGWDDFWWKYFYAQFGIL